MLLVSVHAGVSSEARDLNVDLIIHQHPNFVYESGEGSGESAHMRAQTPLRPRCSLK